MKVLSYFFVLTCLAGATVAEPFFKYAEVKETASLTIQTDSKKENSYGGSAGFRLVFGKPLWNLDARTYVTLPKTKSPAFTSLSSPADFFALWDSPRYGAGFVTNTAFPVTVRGGMLSFSKSVSRLENPAPSSSANPLTKGFGFSAGVGANLPSLSGAAKPLAAFVSVSAPQKVVPLPFQAQCGVTEEQRAYASVSCTIPAGKFVTIQPVLTAGRMKIENKQKYLADTNADFSAQWLYGILWETAVRSPWIKANITAGFQETPFSDEFSSWTVWIKAAARMAYRNVLVDISYFSIPTLSDSPKAVPLVGGSSTVCRTLRQFGINPQLQFELHNAYAATLRWGIHGLFETKIVNTLEAGQYSTLRLNTALAYESRQIGAKITAGVTNVLLGDSFPTNGSIPEKYYSADITSSVALEKAKASLSIGYDHYPESPKTGNTKERFSLDTSLSPGKQRIVTITGGADISCKNGEKTSSSANGSVTIQLKSTFIRASLKCAMTVPL